MEVIKKYFPEFSSRQIELLGQFSDLVAEWNYKINLISRKDVENIEIHHLLHSLTIVKFIKFRKEQTVLDVGTGGGFPGIPLAIALPYIRFVLIDAKGKKVNAVKEMVKDLDLVNVDVRWIRAEELSEKFDFVVSRAVTALPDFFQWVKHLVKTPDSNEFERGILYLKGGDLTAELQPIPWQKRQYHLFDVIQEPFFETKSLVHLVPE